VSIAGETGGGKLCKGNIKNCGNTVTATANSYVPTGELMQGETSSGKLYKGNITIITYHCISFQEGTREFAVTVSSILNISFV
jgi:hypothetical protein